MVWFDSPLELIESDRIHHLLPIENMTKDEQHNSFMRFALIFSICVFLINKKHKVIFIPIFGGLLSYIIYNLNQVDGFQTFEKKTIDDYKCTKPNLQNPFMNVLVSDYKDKPTKEKACDITSEKVKDDMEKYFTNDLFRSVDDVFDKNYSYRQFYTTPNTTIPNDQESFAKWLYYKEGKTCKENNLNCDNMLRK